MKKDIFKLRKKLINSKKDVLKLLEEIDADPRISIIFAYRYLLNREPESLLLVEQNQLSWRELREQFLACDEYKQNSGGGDIYTWQKALGARSELTGSFPDYEQILERAYRKLISSGETVIDIGAHVGRHAKVLAQLVGSEGHLYAFEPLPDQFSFLKKELKQYPAHSTVINKALAAQAGTMNFCQVVNCPQESGLRQRIYNIEDAVTKQIQVEVDTLDNYLDEFREKGISYIKIDTEGAELSILEGGEECLKKHRPIISVEYGKPAYSVYGLTVDSLYNFASEHSYYISDLCGNIVLNIEMWREVCDSVYWDYFLIPQEKMIEFCLKIHG